MTVRCRDGHTWTVETIDGGICLTRPGVIRWISRVELDTLTAPGLDGLRPAGTTDLIRTEYLEVK